MQVWDKLFTSPFGGKCYITTDGKYYVGTQWKYDKVPIGYSRCSGKKGHIALQDTVNILCSAMSNKKHK